MTHPHSDDFRLGSWRVRPSQNRLEADGIELSLEPKAMAVLCYLAGQQGATVGKDQLVAEVWGGLAVSDNAVSRVIAQLRKALGDDAQAPRFIETIPKKGYRMLVAMEPVVVAEPVALVESSLAGARPLRRGRPALWFAGGLLALAVLAGFARLSPQESPGVLRPLTALAGREQDPAWSPDGRFLVFAHTAGEARQSELYLRPRQGEPLRRLTATGLSERTPTWSPDGRQLAYLRGDWENCQVVLAAWTEATGLGEARELAPCQHFPYASLRWGADGLLYLGDRESALTPTPSRIWRLDPRDGRRTALTQPPPHGLGDHAPALSPDGRRLAYLRTPYWNESEIRLRELTSGEERVVASLGHVPRSLSFRADGQELVYEDNREGGRVLALSLDGTEAALRFSSPQPITGLVAGPGRGEFSFSNDLQDANLWAAATTGGEARQVAASSRFDGRAQFGPEGRRFAFASERSGRSALWLQDGEAATLLAELPDGSTVHRLRWSPDGRQILVSSGARHLYVYAFEGGGLRRLDSGTGGASLGEWAPDGRSVYFSSNRGGDWQIWRMALAGGPAERVTRAGGYGAQADAGGQALYYTKYTVPGLWRMDLKTGSESVFLPAFCPCSYNHWLLRSDGVYHLERQSSQSLFYRYDVASGEQALVRRLPESSNEFTLSADGRELIFCHFDRRESDLAMYATD